MQILKKNKTINAMKNLTLFLIFMGFYLTVYAQGMFSDKIAIYDEVSGSTSILSEDFDGDGDMDVLSAFYTQDKIAWYENDGNGNFENQYIITTNTNKPQSVFGADMDGDNDIDVLSASVADDKIAWYKNDGNGNFGDQIIISTIISAPLSIYAADLDGDGDYDVLSGSSQEINWFENDGNGNFGPQNIISDSAGHVISVIAIDLDGDGDMDVLSAAQYHKAIYWYENDGNGNFGEQIIIDTNLLLLMTIYPGDIDEDGDMDILAADCSGPHISWYENDGNGIFANHPLPDSGAFLSVIASDLDRDGDLDMISSSSLLVKNIAWYENDGNGNFGTQNFIGDSAEYAASLFATDLDGDGDEDVLCDMSWYRNNTYSYTQPSDRECCLNSSTEFVIEDALNVLSYQWQKLNGNLFENISDGEHYSGTATQTLTINSVTSDMDNNHYRCLLTIGNNQVASKDAVLIVLPLPETEDITGNPNPAPFDTCIYAVPNPGNSSFDWTVEGGSIIGGTENSKDILWGDAGYGNLSVIETDTNGCQGIPVQLTIIIDIDELLEKYNIRVFPNPTSEKVLIEGDKIQKIEIIDMEGKPVRTFISKKGENFEIDLSGKPAGLYFISFILKDRTLVRKLILE
jgi:hypothetical protein